MEQTFKSVIAMFRFNNSLYRDKIFSLSDKEADHRINSTVNPIKWVAGHLLSSRNHVLNLLGVERNFRFEDVFKGGYDVSKPYPSMKEMRAEFEDITEKLFAQFDKATQAQLEKDLGYNTPNDGKTVQGGIVFFLYHEGWHIGQISVMRRGQGLEGAVPY